MLHCIGIIHDPFGLFFSPLHLVATHAVNRLRRQPDMRHDRDVDRRDRPDNVGHRTAPLNLDSLGTTLLDHTSAISARIFDAGLIRHEGHIRYDKSLRSGALDSPHMIQHLIHGNRQCRIMTGDDNADRITHQNYIDSAVINQARKRKIIRGQYGNALAVLLHLQDVRYCHFLFH